MKKRFLKISPTLGKDSVLWEASQKYMKGTQRTPRFNNLWINLMV